MHSLNFHDFNKYSLKKDFIMNILNNIPIIKKDKQILKKETKKYEEQINDIFFCFISFWKITNVISSR